MKRFLKIGLLVLVAGLLGGAMWQMRQTLSEKETLATRRQRLPVLSGVQYVQNPSPAMLHNKPSLIILFDPDCEHCQYEADQLRQRHAELTHASVYWLTTQPFSRARAFAHTHGLDSLAMMHVGAISREEAYRAFGPTSVPHIFIYGADKQLRREYKGETKIEALLKYL